MELAETRNTQRPRHDHEHDKDDVMIADDRRALTPTWLEAGTSKVVQVVPHGSPARQVQVSVHARRPEKDGYLVAYTPGQERPATATTSYRAGQVSSAAKRLPVALGSIIVYTSQACEVTIDVQGYFE
jgi:hypothetical protein